MLNRKYTYKFYYQVTLILFICIGGATGLFATPKWFLNADVEQNKFWLGYGSGPSLKEARKEAQANLSAQIQSKIEVKENLKQTVFLKAGKFKQKQSSALQVKSRSTLTLRGVEVLKQATQEGKSYVLLVLNKKRYKQSLQRRYENNLTNMEMLYRFNQTQKQNPLRYIELLSALSQQVEKVQDDAYLLKALGKKKIKNNDITIAKIEIEIRQVLNDIKIELKEGNDQKVRLGEALNRPLLFVISYQGQPIPQAKVVCTQAGERLILQSNNVGEIYYQPLVYPERSPMFLVKYPLNELNALSGKRKKQLKKQFNIKAFASAKILAPKVKKLSYSLLITGHEIKVKDKERLKRKIEAKMKSLGWVVSVGKNAALKVEVHADSNFLPPRYNQVSFACFTRIDMRLGDQVQSFYKRGQGTTMYMAVQDSLNNLKLDTKKLLKLCFEKRREL
eukprot:COSAG01_NODE_398_length_17547_cov_206.793501_20_plen_448_part_00